MEKVVLEDIAKLNFASNIQLSPDGKKAVYVVRNSNHKKNTYESNLFLFDVLSGKSKQLTFNGLNSQYIWDDDNTLLLTTMRTEDDKPKPFENKTTLYRLNVNGGEAYPAFTIEENVLNYKKVKEGLYALTIEMDWNQLDSKNTSEDLLKEEEDYHIIEEVPFWRNGGSYVSGKRCVLFLYDETRKTLLRITDQYTNVSSFIVEKDNILFISRTYKDVIPTKSALTLYNMKTKKKTIIVKRNTLRVDCACFTNQGIVFAASTLEPWGNNQLNDLYLYDMKKKTYKVIYENKDLAIGDVPMSDVFFGGGKYFFSVNGTLYFLAMKHYHNSIYELTKQNKVKKVVNFVGAMNGFDTDEKQFVFIGNKPNELNVLYQYKSSKLKACKVFNAEFMKKKYIAKCEYVPFVNQDGVKIDGWVLKPKDYSSKKKYPGLLEIHGGPRAAYSDVFFHEMQTFASEGYFVFFCNPRGSEGYGDPFADIRGKYGDIDYKDLMEFTDHVLKKYPNINEKKLGVLGGSYGGFMCNWIEGHTNRFKAIASQRSISNWVSDFGTSEIGVTFDSNEMQATPWSDMQKMWDQSPLKYACNAKTPILFIHSLEDYNVPVSQGLEMFTAMKYFHVPSRLVLFEKENHSLSRTGRPRHRIRRLKEMHDWFNLYIKKGGKK